MPISLTINGKAHDRDADLGLPLLWALRDVLGLTGTKFGCGIAACGACTVHVDGRAMRSGRVQAGTPVKSSVHVRRIMSPLTCDLSRVHTGHQDRLIGQALWNAATAGA